MVPEQLCGLVAGVFLIELNGKRALLKLTVMHDSDVLDRDGMNGKNGRDGCDGSAFIDQVAVDPVDLLDRSGGREAERISVVPGGRKHLIDVCRHRSAPTSRGRRRRFV